jgi:hypothetical protein
MSQLTVNLGTTPNDRTGDSLRVAFGKVNTNFAEIYTTFATQAFVTSTLAGQVASTLSTYSGAVSGTLATAAQPNVTSVGTLSGLTSSGAVVVANATASTSTVTGALRVAGGIGVGGNITAASAVIGSLTVAGESDTGDLIVGGNLNVTGTIIGAVTGNVTGNISGNAGTSTRLATTVNLAGNSFDGSTSITFANKFIVQGTTDSGLGGAQFLGSLSTGLVKNTATTGVLSIATAGTDYLAPSSLSVTTAAASGVGSLSYSAGVFTFTPAATVTYSLPTATTTTLGGVKVDGSTITINASGVISGSASFTGPSSATLANVVITSATVDYDFTWQFSCASTRLIWGARITISGTNTGSGTINGSANGTGTYYIINTNGTTAFSLSATLGGLPITVTVGTPVGLTYTISASTAQSIPVFSSTTGNALKQSPVIIQDTGAIVTPISSSLISFHWDNQGQLPNASEYHGCIAHVHNDERLYFAHSGAWRAVANFTDLATISVQGISITGTTLASNVTISSLVQVGTITTGVWNGTGIGATYGGTGVNNGNNTITLGGNISTANTFTTSGNFSLALTTTAATNVTLPTSGTLVTTTATSLPSINTLGTITSLTAGTIAATSSIKSSGITGIGYATGAGGTVTQLTNKSTNVVLNKVCGNMVTTADSVAAGTVFFFNIVNSAIASTDVVHVQHISGGTLGAYTCTSTPATGSAAIYVRNNTAGALAEALTLQFVVIKAVTA